MAGISLLCGLFMLFCSSSVSADQQVDELLLENAALQVQVKQLEAQVGALREELSQPDATQVLGGIGYIVGIFGVAGWVAAGKKKRQG